MGLYLLVAGASLSFVLAGLCFLWVWSLPKIIFYWELVHFRRVSFVLMLSATVTAILIMVVSLAYHYKEVKHSLFTYSALRLAAGLLLVGAGALFWLALVPYVTSDYKQVDSLPIDGRMYNLVAYRNIEDHSGLLLYDCDSQNILCRQIARSHPDYTVERVDGKLIYDSSTNELSAEVISALKYVGFTYCLKEPCSTSEH